MRKIFVIVYSVLLVCLLTFGIYYADLNTRSVGFEDAKPVFCCQINEKKIYFHFMGAELNLNSDNNLFITSVANKKVPLRTRFVKALSDFIKRITDLFLRAVGQ